MDSFKDYKWRILIPVFYIILVLGKICEMCDLRELYKTCKIHKTREMRKIYRGERWPAFIYT